jgi:hypothetical protein
MVKPSSFLTAFAVVSLATSLARADGATEAEEKAAAQFFAEGRAAMESADYATACPKFEESVKLVRRSGTLFALSKCAERDKHLVRAAELFRDGIIMLPVGDDRLATSKAELLALEKRVAHLALALPGGAPADARVQLDDAEVRPGAAVAVDPGSHTWVVTAPGRGPHRDTVTLGEGEQKALTVELGPALDEGRAATARRAPGAPADASQPPRGMSAARKAGVAIGAVGLASLVAGGVTGALTLGKKNLADQNCTAGSCSAVGFDAESSGRTLSTVSTVTTLVGLAGLGAGIALFIAGKPDAHRDATGATTFSLSPVAGGGGASIRRSF